MDWENTSGKRGWKTSSRVNDGSRTSKIGEEKAELPAKRKFSSNTVFDKKKEFQNHFLLDDCTTDTNRQEQFIKTRAKFPK